MDIKFKNVSYFYNYGSSLAYEAIKKINLTIPSGSFTSIIGKTGSGKSTLIQHLNGLLIPHYGTIQIGSFIINSNTKKKELTDIRRKVGIVFQFSENQLYEATVLKDIAVGPINLGASEQEAQELAKKMLKKVGLKENLGSRSPFSLSGGQMRRVAIAGILAMETPVLVLDEPTAGLDPKSHEEIMEMFYELHQERKLTTIMVTHQMDDVAKYSDQVILLDNGEVSAVGSPFEIFTQNHHLSTGYPAALDFYYRLLQKGVDLKTPSLTMQKLVSEIKRKFS